MCSTSIGFSRDFLVMKEVTTEKMNQIRGNLYHWFLKHSPTGITHIPKYILFIIKQDIGIYIYVAYSRPNGWTEIFCGRSGVARGCYGL